MFERFTDRARRVVVLAQEEARMLDHNYIGTEHILLGLIHEGHGVAAKALENLGISLDVVRQEVTEIIGRGKQPPSGHIPFTPRAKTVLELSLKEALQLGHNHIGTEHILLGLIREGDGVAAQVLVKMGADPNRVRQQVIQLLHGRMGDEPATGPVSLAEVRMTEDIIRRLAAIDGRLAAIERHLGIEEEPLRLELRKLEEEIARVRKQKEAAIDAQDFEKAVQTREQEKRLLQQRADVEKEWLAGRRQNAADTDPASPTSETITGGNDADDLRRGLIVDPDEDSPGNAAP
jgi:ATP-dependent Clp protease ATP-binding subunit ClpA